MVLKRSLFATVLFSSVSLFCLSACDEDNKEQTVRTFANADACTADFSSEATDEEKAKHTAECQTAYAEAQAEHERSAPHYTTMDQCIDHYGENRCVAGGSGGSYFVPVMTGFMAGYLVSGALHSQPIYHDRWGYAYSGPSSLGYYRGGHVVSYQNNTTWTKNYYVQSVPRGTTPTASTPAVAPATAPARGGFGSAASTTKTGGFTGTSVSSGKSGFSTAAPVASAPSAVARGGFGGAAASAASSSGG